MHQVRLHHQLPPAHLTAGFLLGSIEAALYNALCNSFQQDAWVNIPFSMSEKSE